MTELIACLSAAKITQDYLVKLINSQQWEKVLLVADDLCRKDFPKVKNVEFIITDPKEPLQKLSENIKKQLEKKITGIEVAFNMIAGSGKEHMAVLSALLKLGVGIRLIVLTENGALEL
ncbi:hypothetical protein HYU07_04510 [Candidatus Woesearchaeota archaeon]|nr:hypothetical protein [Candidatus Woesearchaeota archaeon]